MYYAYVHTDHGTPDIYDGDTPRLMVDLGRDIFQGPEYHRLWGIDTPEINRKATKAAAIASRDHLCQLIMNYRLPVPDDIRYWLLIRSYKSQRKGRPRSGPLRDNFGRWLVELFGWNNGQLINLNEQMLLDKFATVYEE